MRRLVLSFAFAFAAIATPILTLPASAAEQVTYSPAALRAAQEAGRPVVVDVSATWCSTCQAQAPLVRSLLKDPKFKDLVLVHVDFDTQKALLRELGVRQQSTFIAYKGRQEVGRSTGDTDRESIEKLFDKTS